MNKILFFFKMLLLVLIPLSCSSKSGNENTLLIMKTTAGDIKIKLYDETPVHRDNFIKLINSEFYDGISFHRVIKNFMVQAGDPNTRTVKITAGADTIETYTIPSEFNKIYFHKKGALAAAREGNNVNPEMRSSGTQFYLVQGTILTDEELLLSEQRINSNLRQAMFNLYNYQVSDSVSKNSLNITAGQIQEIVSEKMFNYLTTIPEYKIPEDQRAVYKTIGGVPRLDQTYTVFGEVIEGLDVIDKIAEVQTNSSDKPVNDIKIIKIRIIN